MIKKWHLKAIIQKTISFFPFKHRLNYFFQKYVTHGLDMTDLLFYDRITHATDHIAAYRRHAEGRPLHNAFELGSGWYPIVPISLFLYGVDSIVTTDLSRLCNKPQLLIAVEMFLSQIDQGKLPDTLTQRSDRIDALRDILRTQDQLSFEAMLERLHIRYEVLDATRMPPEFDRFDLVTSNNTFEHIYPDVLRQILQNLYRITRKGGVMSHFIDLSDHYAHLDRSITIYNFLRFSEKTWRWIDNSVQPMNRYRITDYRRLYAESGIPVTEEINRPGNLDELKQIPLDRIFAQNQPADNAVSHSLVISVRPID